jgi:RNA polymerase sigma factor (sigma-70 family)
MAERLRLWRRAASVLPVARPIPSALPYSSASPISVDSAAMKPRPPAFMTTRWSVVVAAGTGGTPDGREALSKLCQSYWYPLYSFARRRGHSPEDAQDLTQEFLARLLEKNWIGDADRNKGRFRTFLLTAMKHFLSDEWDKARAQKRGGGLVFQSLESHDAESRYSQEPAANESPERTFEVRWALALLEQVVQNLRAEYEREGKTELFAALHPCLVGERTAQPYAELAKSLESSESTVKSAVHRLRQRYRQLLRAEIANTLAAPDDVDEEMRYLFSCLSY